MHPRDLNPDPIDDILIGIGGNLPSRFGLPPIALAQRAAGLLEKSGVRIVRRSGWYLTRPQPRSDQPWFCNAVWLARAALSPEAVLDRLLATESELGRIRSQANAPRCLDLDLLTLGDRVRRPAGPTGLCLPHPRLHLRDFVLYPLRDVAPGWRHPVFGKDATVLLAEIAADCRPVKLADAWGENCWSHAHMGWAKR